MARRRLARRYRKNPDSGSITASAMPMGELWGWVGPGFGAFAAARFVTYLATTFLEKKKPSWGKHGGAGAALGTFLAAWLLAHRVKWLKSFAEPIVIGAGIAAAQSLVQLYVPKVGWMVGDPTAGTESTSSLVSGAAQSLPPGFTPIDDDPTLYDYNDAHDPGIYGAQPQAQQAPAQQQAQGQQVPDDLFADLDVNGSDDMGIFAS